MELVARAFLCKCAPVSHMPSGQTEKQTWISYDGLVVIVYDKNYTHMKQQGTVSSKKKKRTFSSDKKKKKEEPVLALLCLIKLMLI